MTQQPTINATTPSAPNSSPAPWPETSPPAARHPARALLALLAAGLAASAGLAFDGAFTVAAIAPLCLASAAVPGLIVAISVLVGERTRRGGEHRDALRVLATLAACVVAWAGLLPPVAAALAVAGTPGSTASPWHLVGSLASAPKQLLTTVPPAAPTGTFLLALGTLVWWAAAWSALAAVRQPGSPPGGDSAGHTGGGLLPLAAPALVLLAGTAAGIPAGSAAQLWPAALFTALAVTLISARRALLRRPAKGRGPGLPARVIRTLLGTGIVAVVTGVAVVIAPILPGLASRPPADPRPLVAPPAAPDVLLDPLSLVSAWVSGPPRPLFTATTSDPVNLRWLVLDSYDGAGWSSDASYLPAGSRLPAAGNRAVPTQPVDETVRITGLPGMWLPAADRPAQLSGIAVRVDPASGMLATYDGSPASGLDYQVTSDVASPRLSELVSAVPGAGPALAGQLSLPAGLPSVVASYGSRAVAGAASPYQEMVLLQDHMLADFRYSTQAAPGESYGHLAFFVSGHHVGGPGVFATLFAVLARQAGFPSRIVVGFTPGQPAGPDQYQVTTADALAWPEVYFNGLGWVPFYPLPRPGPATSRQAVRALGEPASRSAIDRQAVRQVPSAGTRKGPPAHVSVPTAGPGGTAAADAAIVTFCVLAGLACCYLLGMALLRGVTRYRRRTHPDPRHRVAGAWQDVLGGIRAAGSIPVAPLTAEEIAQQGTTLLGPAARQPLQRLAGLANAALFAPAPPSHADADAAWADAVQVRRLAWRRASWRSRFAALLLPLRR
jgi:transglutaminase-like putative cysteine protease